MIFACCMILVIVFQGHCLATVYERYKEIKMVKSIPVEFVCLFVCHGPWKSSNGSSRIFRDLASSPRGIEKGSSLPPVLMVGMNKQIPTS